MDGEYCDMSHAVNLLNPSEEIILLEQLELLKQQHAEFQPEVERVYVKLLLRKVGKMTDFTVEITRQWFASV